LNNDIKLDCSSEDSLFKSLAEIYTMDVNELKNAIDKFKQTSDLDDFQKHAVAQAEAMLPTPTKPAYTLWHHASRVKDTNSFYRNGVMTKANMSNELFEMLVQLSDGLTKEGELPNKASVSSKFNIIDEGPFAFLFEDPKSSHNFHEAPEIVEDIAGSLLGGNYMPLVELFKNETKPCTVTFQAPFEERELEKALFYVYMRRSGSSHLDASRDANVYYDAKGKAIKKEDVINVKLI
jgi:hypothetical protein